MREHLFIPRAAVVEKNAFLTELATGKKILDIGLGGYVSDPEATAAYLERDLTKTLQGRLSGVAKEVTGVDINPECVDRLASLYPQNRYAVADVTADGFADRVGSGYELVVFADVLEHLDSFREAMANLKAVLAERGEIVITTVNAYAVAPLVKMLFGYESVHEEHTSYFSYMTLRRLLDMNGLEMIDFRFYRTRRVSFDSGFDRAAYAFSNSFVRLFPQYAPGVLCVARPAVREPAAAILRENGRADRSSFAGSRL